MPFFDAVIMGSKWFLKHNLLGNEQNASIFGVCYSIAEKRETYKFFF